MPTLSSRILVSILTFIVPAAAGSAQGWSVISPSPASPAPGARNRAAMAYDAARGVTLLFGGYNGTATPLSDFWSFNGTGWQQLGGAMPAARWGHGMVYDTRRERLVLFGGFQPSPGNPVPDAIGLSDTWEYDGFGWTQVASTGPSPRGYFGMAYDPIRQRTVLFGGAGPNTTYLQDTWEWSGVTWTQVNTPQRPSIRRGPAMAYDLERAEVVLFGGGALGTQFGDTWVYNGITWTQRMPTTSPPSRWESTMAFDPLCGRALLQGGTTFTYQTIYADSWNWDGFAWTQVTGTQPSARHGVAAAFDLQAGRSLWFGGRDSAGFRSDLWGWSGGCNRTMTTVTYAIAGQTAQYRYNYPTTGSNNVYLELWTLRNPNAFVLPIPGFVPVGLTRVDVFFILLQSAGVLGGSGQQNSWAFTIPNTPTVVGFTFDVQDLDIDLASNFAYWASNDIEATIAPPVPVAGFTASPTLGMAPLTVNFTDTSLYATSWQWDFENDGIIDATWQNPSFTYGTSGQYSVRLVATGPGGSNTIVQSGLITAYGPASFSATPSSGVAPLTVQFTDSSTFATSWQWDFQDDGIVDSTAQHPSFTYSANGFYTVRLVVNPGARTLVRNALVVLGFPGGFSPDPALNMVAIQPGTFQMGSAAVGGWSIPVHQVTITRPFWMGRYEVTQAHYQALMGVNPSHFQGPLYPNASQRPVELVSWSDAVAYCQALTVVEQVAGRLPPGYEYRLPTEAEWEYCCRAGTTTEWNVGSSIACPQANFSPNVTSGIYCVPGGQTTVVGSYLPNAFGLYDMHGNVYEWCLDGFSGYSAGSFLDPYLPSSPLYYPVNRGGACVSAALSLRSAIRGSPNPPGFPSWFYGFRVVCAPILP